MQTNAGVFAVVNRWINVHEKNVGKFHKNNYEKKINRTENEYWFHTVYIYSFAQLNFKRNFNAFRITHQNHLKFYN